MWSAEPQAVWIVGANSVSCWFKQLAAGHGQPVAQQNIVVTDGGDRWVSLTNALVELAEACIRLAPRSDARTTYPVSVLVAECWLGIATVPWSSAMLSDIGANRTARRQLAEAGCESASEDVVRLDDGAGLGRPRLAVGYPAELLAALASAAGLARLSLASVQPMGVVGAMAARLRRDDGWVAVAHGDTLQLLRFAAGRPLVVASMVDLSLNCPTPEVCTTLWRRIQLREPALATQDRVPLLDVDGGREWAGLAGFEASPCSAGSRDWPWAVLRAVGRSPPWEAMPAKARVHGGMWLASAACAVLALGLAWHAGRAARHAAEAEATRTSVTAPLVSTDRLKPDEEKRLRAASAVVAQLNLPTEGMLKVAAPPRDLRVALLSIDMDGTTVAAPPSDRVTRAASLPFRVTAESPSAAEMAGYVAYLGDRPHVTTAYLLRHEVAENEPAKPYRFTVELAWRE